MIWLKKTAKGIGLLLCVAFLGTDYGMACVLPLVVCWLVCCAAVLLRIDE